MPSVQEQAGGAVAVVNASHGSDRAPEAEAA
jgi:hypothetical protein